MKKSRIKWGNVGVLIMFIVCSLLMLKDASKLVFSTIQYTNFGLCIAIITFIVWFLMGSWLENEMQ